MTADGAKGAGVGVRNTSDGPLTLHMQNMCQQIDRSRHTIRACIADTLAGMKKVYLLLLRCEISSDGRYHVRLTGSTALQGP